MISAKPGDSGGNQEVAMAFQFTIERPRISGVPMLVRMSGRLTLGPQLIDFGRRIRELIVSGADSGEENHSFRAEENKLFAKRRR